MEHVGSGQAEQDKTVPSPSRLALPRVPGTTSGFSPPLPGTCLVLCLEGGGMGPCPEPLQLLPFLPCSQKL